MVTPEKDLGFTFSMIRQWEWTDLTTDFSALRHCSLTLSSHIIHCNPLTILLYRFQSRLSCITEPQDRHRIPDAFSKYQTGIIIFLDFPAMISLHLQLAFVAGRMHYSLILSRSHSRTARLFPTKLLSSQSVLSLSCRASPHAKSRTLHLSVLKFHLLQSNSPPQQDAY